MALFELYSRNIYVRYKGNVCSKASAFVIFCTLITVIGPFILAFSTHGFWWKIGQFREQPDLYFKGKVLVILEGKNIRSPEKPKEVKQNYTNREEPLFLTWSNFPIYNHLNQDHLRASVLRFVEEDTDRDGIYDVTRISMEIPLNPWEEIYSFKLLLFFDYHAKVVFKIQMEILAFIQYMSYISGSSFYGVTEIELDHQTIFTYDDIVMMNGDTVINESSTNLEDYKLANILQAYALRKVRAHVTDMYPVWSAGKDSKFSIKIDLMNPEETFHYIPSFLEKMKWAWIQYVGYLFIFIVIFGQIKSFVFENHLLPVTTELPWKVHVT